MCLFEMKLLKTLVIMMLAAGCAVQTSGQADRGQPEPPPQRSAGQLIARSYSRKEEYEADRHGAEILQRAGYSKDVMINTLTWLMQTEGASGGGFFATHPATGDRIEALKKS